MNIPVIKTERLVMRILDPTFAKKVSDFHIRNRDFHEKWDPLRDESYYREEYHRKELEDELHKINGMWQAHVHITVTGKMVSLKSFCLAGSGEEKLVFYIELKIK